MELFKLNHHNLPELLYCVIAVPYILTESYNFRHPNLWLMHPRFLVQIYQVKFNVRMAERFKLPEL